MEIPATNETSARARDARTAPRARLRPSGAMQVGLLAGALVAAAFSLAFAFARHLEPLGVGPQVPWWVLVMGFWVAEAFVVHLQFKRDAHSFSLSEIPLVIGLFFAAPVTVILARVAGSALALLAHRHQRPEKVAFNLGQFWLGTTIAVLLFHHAVRIGDPFGPAGWLGAFAGAMAADLMATAAITAAIWMTGGGLQSTVLSEVVTVGAFATVTNTAMGLMAVTILLRDPRAAWLLLLAGGAVFLAYRGYATLRVRQESLESLYASTQLARGATTIDAVVPALLTHALAMFRAGSAELALASRQQVRRFVMSAEEGLVVDATRPDLLVTLMKTGQEAIIVSAAEAGPLGDALRARGLRDAMVAPIHGDVGPVGLMIVGNRLGDVASFDPDELRLFETLANHASVAVDNAQLIEQLRNEAERNEHLALHDPLTGLANRTLIRTRIRQRLAACARDETRAAVMIIDLDRFKEINDTLGHHTGDLLLQEVARRFSGVLGDAASVARLGGDEFGVLVGGFEDEAPARRTAETILRSLDEPFLIDDLTLDLGASIGIALYPAHGGDADTLLQRADVALYIAKEERAAFQVYDPSRDRHTPERLALVGELRRAIGGDGLSLAFQPKQDLASGRIVGAEALVRWTHPQRGVVPADELIPLAEHTGMIKPLTGWVLGEALQACRTWRAEGSDLSVAVNLSARLLRDERLPEQVGAMLAAWSVPASALVLEITEGSLLDDPERAITILTGLHDMGVSLSIDDFGTGYSSLAYLKRLPVRELKMDRSFVMGMLETEEDAVIVRSTIDLGKNLGMRVVAEGVESAAIVDELRHLGCDIVQGYHIARPMTGEAFARWAAARDQTVPFRSDMRTVVA